MEEIEREPQFVALYDAHWRALLGYALRRTRGAEEAADVVAEAFLVAWRRIEDVPIGDEARLWLYGTARRVIANQRRGSVRRNRLGERLKHHLVAEAPGGWESNAETAQLVRLAMNRLDDDDRELLRLTNWEGISPSEVAQTMGMPAATVRTRLHRARINLRHELETLGWNSEQSATGRVSAGERPLALTPEKQQ